MASWREVERGSTNVSLIDHGVKERKKLTCGARGSRGREDERRRSDSESETYGCNQKTDPPVNTTGNYALNKREK
jgi:hypothetical protein